MMKTRVSFVCPACWQGIRPGEAREVISHPDPETIQYAHRACLDADPAEPLPEPTHPVIRASLGLPVEA
jgi:hypothetical protein